MATSRSLGQLAKRMDVVADQFEVGLERVVIVAAETAAGFAILATPVRTGRAKSNWVGSTTVPIEEDRMAATEEDPITADEAELISLEQVVQVLGTYELIFGSIFLTNITPYIEMLEAGSSRQAPAGMAALAVQAAAEQVRREVRRGVLGRRARIG